MSEFDYLIFKAFFNLFRWILIKFKFIRESYLYYYSIFISSSPSRSHYYDCCSHFILLIYFSLSLFLLSRHVSFHTNLARISNETFIFLYYLNSPQVRPTLPLSLPLPLRYSQKASARSICIIVSLLQRGNYRLKRGKELRRLFTW